jgi:hypothetical protein
MTRDEQNAYSKGYAAGSRGRWPLHRPPLPPDEIVRAIVEPARALRDAADSLVAILDEGDEFAKKLGPPIDAFDEAMTRLGLWLVERPKKGT